MGVKCKALRPARQSGYRTIMRTYFHLKLLHNAVKTSVLELVLFSKVMVSFVSQFYHHISSNVTFFKCAMINMAESLRVHSLIARAALHSRASAGCNFGQTAGPSLIKFGTRGGGGRAGEGRGGDCPHFPQTRTFVTAEPSRTPASRVTG